MPDGGRRDPLTANTGVAAAPWYPETIGETILMALDPQSAYVTRDMSDLVSVVEDRVTGDTYEQSSGPAQPLWIESDAAHSRAALTLDGARRLSTVDDVLAHLMDEAAPYTAFIVHQRSVLAETNTLLSVCPASSASVVIERWNTTNKWNYFRNGTAGDSTTSDANAACLWTGIYNGTGGYTGRLNGVDDLGTYATPASCNTSVAVADAVHVGMVNYIGAFIHPFKGNISLILVFAGKLSLAKVQDMEAWLQSEYTGLP